MLSPCRSYITWRGKELARAITDIVFAMSGTSPEYEFAISTQVCPIPDNAWWELKAGAEFEPFMNPWAGNATQKKTPRIREEL